MTLDTKVLPLVPEEAGVEHPSSDFDIAVAPPARLLTQAEAIRENALHVLRAVGGDREKAARILAIGPRTFTYDLKRYAAAGIEVPPAPAKAPKAPATPKVTNLGIWQRDNGRLLHLLEQYHANGIDAETIAGFSPFRMQGISQRAINRQLTTSGLREKYPPQEAVKPRTRTAQAKPPYVKKSLVPGHRGIWAANDCALFKTAEAMYAENKSLPQIAAALLPVVVKENTIYQKLKKSGSVKKYGQQRKEARTAAGSPAPAAFQPARAPKPTPRPAKPSPYTDVRERLRGTKTPLPQVLVTERAAEKARLDYVPQPVPLTVMKSEVMRALAEQKDRQLQIRLADLQYQGMTSLRLSEVPAPKEEMSPHQQRAAELAAQAFECIATAVPGGEILRDYWWRSGILAEVSYGRGHAVSSKLVATLASFDNAQPDLSTLNARTQAHGFRVTCAALDKKTDMEIVMVVMEAGKGDFPVSRDLADISRMLSGPMHGPNFILPKLVIPPKIIASTGIYYGRQFDISQTPEAIRPCCYPDVSGRFSVRR